MKHLTVLGSLLCVAVWTTGSFAEAPKPRAPKTTAPAKREKAAKPKVERWTYNMLFRGSKVGQMTRKETTSPDGTLVVRSKSKSKIRVFFRTVKGSLDSTTVHKKGKLISADISGVQQNKPYSVKVARTAKGLKVSVTRGKKTKTKVFADSDYDATTADPRLPMKPKGKRVTRRLLQLDKLKVVKQKLHFRRYTKKKVGTKTIKLTEVRAKGPKGSATMYFVPQGWMMNMAVRVSIFGSFEIQLQSHKPAK
ncbi:MAG: hypothetical protein EP343_15620 [Deltaproteobacteria bacterium]|nr:MAG: hypothetical protein EP343_15620 [Deltaproteobacteria bacterium]